MHSKDLPVLLLLIGLVAGLWAYPWLASTRSAGERVHPEAAFIVTSTEDSGPGSLREAIFQVLRAAIPMEIVIETDEVRLSTPLPPIVTRQALRITGSEKRPVIRAPEREMTPMLDIRSGPFLLSGVELVGAAQQAVQISTDQPVQFVDIVVRDSDVAIGSTGSVVLDVGSSLFESNRVGVELLAGGIARIRDSSFEDNSEAGVWAVASASGQASLPELDLRRNGFIGGRYGVVAANFQSRLVKSVVGNQVRDGVLVLGGEIDVSDNRFRATTGAAIRLAGVDSATISENEISDSVSIGVLSQYSRFVTINDNEIYRNGYGIVTLRNVAATPVAIGRNQISAQQVDGIAIIGDSPVLSDNSVSGNGAAGIRQFNLRMEESRLLSQPLYVGNALFDNNPDGPVIQEFVVAEASP